MTGYGSPQLFLLSEPLMEASHLWMTEKEDFEAEVKRASKNALSAP